jgi:quercetin dioxygenase-like cupin family protein
VVPKAGSGADSSLCPSQTSRKLYASGVIIQKGPPSVQVDLFGGRGEVNVWNLLHHAAGPFTAVLSCELSVGGSVGRHLQEQFAELVIGVEGEGEASVDGQPARLSAGDVVYLPLGAILTIANRSNDVPLRYLIVKAVEASAP